MTFKGFENYRQISDYIRNDLGNISKTMLAGLLGVTERSLSEWENRPIGEATPKALRLELLFKVVLFLKKEFPNVPQKMYREILNNSRIVFDLEDEEDGTISLLGMIVADPKNKYWESVVRDCVSEYLRSIEFKGEHFEQGRNIQHA